MFAFLRTIDLTEQPLWADVTPVAKKTASIAEAPCNLKSSSGSQYAIRASLSALEAP